MLINDGTATMLLSVRMMCAGDIDAATGLIQRCLAVDQTSSDAHILMARVRHVYVKWVCVCVCVFVCCLSSNFETLTR